MLADLYRQQARSLRERLGADARLFYVGNWGWRWYAEAEGMEPYLPGVSPLGGGDLLVVPETPSGLRGLHSRDAGRVETLYEFSVEPTLVTRLRTASPHPTGGYYAFRRPGLPWYPSRRPLERFRILRVRGP